MQQNICVAKVYTILRQDNLVDGRGHVVGRHGRIIVDRILNRRPTSAAPPTSGISQDYSEQHQSLQDMEEGEESKQDMKRTGSIYI